VSTDSLCRTRHATGAAGRTAPPDLGVIVLDIVYVALAAAAIAVVALVARGVEKL
jgi:hypothetical protein